MSAQTLNRSGNPNLQLNGLPLRTHTFPISGHNEDLLVIDDSDKRPLDVLLRAYRVKHKSGRRDDHFWPLKLLLLIFSRKRILAELMKHYDSKNAAKYLDIIRPNNDQEICFNTPLHLEWLGLGHTQNCVPSYQTYLRIFALLVYLQKGSQIANFINEGISDQNLPVYVQEGTEEGDISLCLKRSPDQPLASVRGWNTYERELFENKQWQLLIPYFDLDERSLARHYGFCDSIRFPWCCDSSLPSAQGGGYGEVTRIKIDCLSHGFREILQKLSLKQDCFALKMLYGGNHNDETTFRNEVEQLRRFNGFVSEHLITLLASYTYQKKYYFIFPWAEGDLEKFMYDSHKQKPIMDIATAQWAAKQIHGIMAAIDHIHNPEHLNTLSTKEKKYGKHGDIKPDNILWFQSTNDPLGLLVVSDLGLSTLNRDTSRSNIPNKLVPPVPLYRPPECDVTGGTISRAYDIWTLGCLFLELITWLLGGANLLDEFDDKRTSIYILTGGMNNMFFELKRLGSETVNDKLVYVAQIKPQVTSWFITLHKHKGCTQFIHDVLDIVETQMLVVISQDTKRASSGELRKKFKDMLSKCMDDSRPDYATKGISIVRKPKPPNLVKVELNDEANKNISQKQLNIPIHLQAPGEKIRNSRTRREMENIDHIH